RYQRLTIWQEQHGAEPIGVALESRYQLSSLHVPEPDAPIRTPGSQQPAVTAEGGAGYLGLVPLQDELVGHRGKVPDPEVAGTLLVSCPQGQMLAIRAE